jgi:hypothetical protein
MSTVSMRQAVGLERVDGERAELVRHLDVGLLDMLGVFELVTLEVGGGIRPLRPASSSVCAVLQILDCLPDPGLYELSDILGIHNPA